MVALSLLIVSGLMQNCKKKDEDVFPKLETAVSKWTINGAEYTAASTKWLTKTTFPNTGTDNLVASRTGELGAGGYVAVSFTTKPTVSGQYSVFIGNNADLPANKVAIEVWDGASTWYHANSGTVTVTVTNGKLKIDYSNVTDFQNTKLTGNLIEQ